MTAQHARASLSQISTWLPLAVVALLAIPALAGSCTLDHSGTIPVDGTGATGAGAGTAGTSTTSGTAGTGGGVELGCTSPADCTGTDGDCGQRTCIDEQCGFSYAAAGTACQEQGGSQCDGQGRCVECLGADDCAPGSCVGGEQTGGETCQGGACVAVPGTTPCAPYLCDGDRCATDCTSTSHAGCVATHYCDGSSCVEDLDQGDSCSATEQCPGDRCVDGRCCNETCNGTCESCARSGREGTCTPYAAYADPESECSSAPFGCDGSGACSTCGFAPDPASSCSSDSRCDRCDGGDTCVIVGNQSDEYEGQTITCPAGFHCRVECDSHHACKDAIIGCPDDYDCTVRCGNSDHQCQNATINCSTRGPCFVDCIGGDTCDGAKQICGDNSCNANCISGGKPAITCGSSCDCSTC
ncbi:MAG: hypothetical protein JRI23_20710 [Deltaproteobacteria bacterium]|jgi:hypothetical protein|nr:hypothetical protein [Deltaproteobacteria bacterium]MBW2534326.1 hypothetical protein [Deltaproteobacteria bacterium]